MNKLLKIQCEIKEMSFEEVYNSFKPYRFKMLRTWMSKLHETNVNEEDLMKEIDIVFWKAYENYDLQKSNGVAFITFVTVYIEQKMMNFRKSQFADKRSLNNNALYLNDLVNANHENDTEFIDLIPVETFEDEVVANIALDQAIKRCNPNQLRIIKLLAQGYQGKEVAEIVGTTKQYIAFVKTQFCQKAKLKKVI